VRGKFKPHIILDRHLPVKSPPRGADGHAICRWDSIARPLGKAETDRALARRRRPGECPAGNIFPAFPPVKEQCDRPAGLYDTAFFRFWNDISFLPEHFSISWMPGKRKRDAPGVDYGGRRARLRPFSRSAFWRPRLAGPGDTGGRGSGPGSSRPGTGRPMGRPRPAALRHAPHHEGRRIGCPEAVVDVDHGQTSRAGGQHPEKGCQSAQRDPVPDTGRDADDRGSDQARHDAGEGSLHPRDDDEDPGSLEPGSLSDQPMDPRHADIEQPAHPETKGLRRSGPPLPRPGDRSYRP
jgi:hypothetical protein